MKAWQGTLQEKLCVDGIGLHSGRPCALQVLPSEADSGIVFVRADLPCQPEILARVENLVDTTLATTLGVPMPQGGLATVSTVEHLLAAMMSLGVDNARILLHGPEVPVLDGSAAPWARSLLAAGIEKQNRRRTYLRVRDEVVVSDGAKEARLQPHAGLRISCSLDFDHPLIGHCCLLYTS